MNQTKRIQPLDAKQNLTNNKNNTRRRHDKRRQDQGRNPTRKSVPPRARKRTKSGRVREGQNSRIRRPSESGHFLIEVLFKIGRFWARAGPGPVWGVFGGSKTGCPKGRPETPPRRSTTRSKSTRSSRLCSVSLSSVLFRSVLLRDIVIGKIFFLRPEVGLFFLRPEIGLENSSPTFGRSRWTRSRRRSSRSSSVNRRRSILGIESSTHSKTCAPPQPQREREFRTILIRPLDTSS